MHWSDAGVRRTENRMAPTHHCLAGGVDPLLVRQKAREGARQRRQAAVSPLRQESIKLRSGGHRLVAGEKAQPQINLPAAG